MEEVFVLIGPPGRQASEASIAASVQESVESDFPAIANVIREKPFLAGRFHRLSNSVTRGGGRATVVCIGLQIPAYRR